MERFEKTTHLAVSADALWRYHAAPGALDRLVPPFEPVEFVRRAPALADGTEVEFKLGPLKLLRWLARHQNVQPGASFQDIQVKGPFAAWTHTHRFEPHPDGATLVDHIEYRLPLHPVGGWIAGWAVRRQLRQMFAFRHQRTQDDLERMARMTDKPLTIGITGASGMVGQALAGFLSVAGHTVVPLIREGGSRPDLPGDAAPLQWLPFEDAPGWHELDAVVLLAGASVAQRWTDEAKRRIRESRVDATRQLVDGLKAAKVDLDAFVSASAIGAYPTDESDRAYTEDDPFGDGFLAQVVRDWEAEVAQAPTRTVMLRLGVVLSPAGGALEQMLTPFKLGAGGPIGGGKQWMPWVALDDVVGAFAEAVTTPSWSGPINVVAPNPVRQKKFAKALGKALGRPAFMPLPAFAVKAMFGEMGETLLLEGTRVAPARLEALGFSFAYAELTTAFSHLLGRQPPG